LVTGGSGFIGTNLVETLITDNEVLSLDLLPPKIKGHAPNWRQVDLLDRRGMTEVFSDFRPDVIFHLGARTDLHGRTLADYDVNVTGVANVIHATTTLDKQVRTIYASSRLVFAIDHRPAHDFDYRPSTVYGQSKIAGEEIVRERAAPDGNWCIVRPTSIWGPWFGIPYRDFFDAVSSGRYVNVRGHSPRKTYGFVGNSVHQLISMATAKQEKIGGKVFWLADYSPILLTEWASLISDVMDVRSPRTLPYGAVRAAARIGDALRSLGIKEPPITSFRLANLLTDMVYDTRLTEEVVGPLPFSLEDGVHQTAGWIKNTEHMSD
jgi:nucleoside-diphosphate-sugar epimerase